SRAAHALFLYYALPIYDSRGIFVMITLAAVFVITLLPRERWRVDDALLTAFVLYCGLTHIRFLVMAGIVLPPILVHQLGNMSSYNPAHERRVLNAAVIAVVIALLVLGFPTAQALEAQVVEFFPVRAANYLRTNPQNGNIFNQYDWGGFLEWNLPHS